MTGHGSGASERRGAEVRRLRMEGLSIRAIAEAVFGDRRYRGRVERILSSQDEPVAEAVDVEAEEFDRLGSAAVLRLLFERRLRVWFESGKAPPMRELRTALDVRRQLEALEAIERVKDLTRSERADD